MLWPTPADYAQAVGGYPDVCLLDPQLRGGKPKKTPTNQLLVYTGGFSTVFPIEVAHKDYALRCWNKDIGDSKNRYEMIDNYLKQVHLPYFVGFEYVSEGILINGKKWPITRMEWANGESLRDFIRHNLHDPKIFSIVANEFRKMFETLHANQISHGDLQSGNIMLGKNGTNIIIKLIDYDSLFVPALRGQKSPTPGLPEYQHPSRIDKCDEKMDYFSELVIYLSFLSLSEKPELWNQFKDKTEKGLLFSKDDFENPNQSDIFYELDNQSPEIQQLTATLKDYCAKTSLDQLQPLEAILPKPDANIHTNHGFVLLKDKQIDRALTEFQKAIDINPIYKKAHYGIGLAHLHSKRFNEAISAFEYTIIIDPNYIEVHHGLGLAYYETGDYGKAELSANAAIKINPHFQPAKQLLDTIKSSTVTSQPKASKVNTKSKSSNPINHNLQSFVSVLRTHWQFITPGILGVGLIICLIAFLTQMSAKNSAISQKVELKNQLVQKDAQIQGLNASIQTLESNKTTLKKKYENLLKEVKNNNITYIETSRNVVRLKSQLNEQKEKNRQLQNILITQGIEIGKLQNDESDALKNKSVLERQIAQKQLEMNRLNNNIKKYQKEKTELQSDKLKLQTDNIRLTRLKDDLEKEIASLKRQLNGSIQSFSNNKLDHNQPDVRQKENLVDLEPPKEINTVKDSATQASANYNNNGIKSLKSKDFDTAVKQFKQAVLADSNFKYSHYNLGCAYYNLKKYPLAIQAFSKAINLDNRFEKAYYNRSLSYLMTNNKYREAKRDAEKAISINRNYQRAHNLLDRIQQSEK